MMKWETITTQPCSLNPGSAVECETLAAEDSSGAGLLEPRLVLKPAYATIQVGDALQYRTYFVQNGVEQEVTSGLEYKSGSLAIAQIGVATGSALGLAEGIASITVTWGGLFASAQLNVVASCSDSMVATCLLVDCSPSMGQAMSGYGSKLNFAKTVAARLANELNTNKDSAIVAQFEALMTILQENSATPSELLTAISGIGLVNSAQGTNLIGAIKSAIAALDEVYASTRVVMVFTDGVCNELNSSTLFNDLAEIANSGVVIIVCGVRASGDGFTLLQSLATGGFFVNAYDLVTGQEASDLMSGLKGYLCSGNCNATEPYTVNEGDPDYQAFADWDVINGPVDLFGNGYYDFLPGNGLYVNLCGIGTEESELHLEHTWTMSAYPQNLNTLTDVDSPHLMFGIPKIVDGINLKSCLAEYNSLPIADSGAGLLQDFSVYGSMDGVTYVLIKSFSLDCTDLDQLNHLIGESSTAILRLENNTAYRDYRLVMTACCGAETAVILKSVGWYTKTLASVPSLGLLRTKLSFALFAGQLYRLSIRVAGNQRYESYTDQLRIRVGPVGGPYQYDHTTSAIPWDEPFTTHTYTFTPAAGGFYFVSIEQLSAVQPGSGCLLDWVKLERISLPALTLFDYDFDSENPQVIDPGCPEGYGYLYTNCGGYGCLDVPPAAQVPDPNPLDKIE